MTRSISPLQITTYLLALVVALPFLVILISWGDINSEIWEHLLDYLFLDLLTNTLWLILGVGGGVLVLGTTLAWLTTLCDFPGRSIFDWALMLPFAIPAYVLAFVMLDLFSYGGTFHQLIDTFFGGMITPPDIQSTGGVITVFVLVFYPYVYMLARTAFLSQGNSLLEAGQSLGLTPTQAFLRIALPMARPAIAAGVALALMETLADFGAVSIFNYDTFTLAIYTSWDDFRSLSTAAQLSSLLLLFALMALFGEQAMRGRSKYHQTTGRTPYRHQLKGWKGWSATTLVITVLFFSFITPVAQLLIWGIEVLDQELNSRYFEMLYHTLILGAGAALLAVLGAFALAMTRRQRSDWKIEWIGRLITLGYALPGSVLAVGIMILFANFGHAWNTISEWFGGSASSIMMQSVPALLFAYLVRFLTVAHGPVESSLERIKPSMEEAARSLGESNSGVMRRIYLPILTPGIFMALLMVMIDVMKELPATYLLRPYGWDTFAVRTYEMASEGMWEHAALPALSLVIVGLLPVIVLVRKSR
ncbi:MAG TPA: iron ABC transporter permease [Gammaproteobacteria bacterium]|jgi:iron(III) transport system permease protein|nr:iron ABC transporter permease [Gammaproteobacteria bacterium]MBT6553978.1 iron ABC transporter permease [Candidatus Neomarinimicrobiota bacterium]MBT3845656.1 iron ABC transporter permease [Gammaproteobacteria bacterium]MBT3892223.1 iron ABC transporter permease [Gammaproteobacteria bacterium]MBT5371723.1 iron ABC transporter permease [Gammaproteobacteria bacterium]